MGTIRCFAYFHSIQHLYSSNQTLQISIRGRKRDPTLADISTIYEANAHRIGANADLLLNNIVQGTNRLPHRIDKVHCGFIPVQ